MDWGWIIRICVIIIVLGLLLLVLVDNFKTPKYPGMTKEQAKEHKKKIDKEYSKRSMRQTMFRAFLGPLGGSIADKALFGEKDKKKDNELFNQKNNNK